MRRLTILGAYGAASLVGSTVFMTLLMSIAKLDGIEADETVAYLLFMFCLVAIAGGVISATIAGPAIVLTERKKFGPWWLFGLVGFAAGCALVAMFFYRVSGELETELALFPVSTTAAGITYWLIAWRLYPPSSHEPPPVEVFE